MKVQKFKLNKDFRRLYGRGKPYVSDHFVMYVMRSRFDGVRLGITTGKKIGNAVCRNRARRVLTAAFRQNVNDLLPGVDLVLVARTRILSVKSTLVAEEMRRGFLQAGVVHSC